MRRAVLAGMALAMMWSEAARAQSIPFTVTTSTVVQLLPVGVPGGGTRHHERVCNVTATGGAVLWISRLPGVVAGAPGTIPLPPLASSSSAPTCQEFGAIGSSSFVPQTAMYAIASGGTASVTVDNE